MSAHICDSTNFSVCRAGSARQASVNVRHEPPCVHHVFTIVIPECLEHERFLASDAAKIQNAKAEQARQSRHPIRQQECLSQRPQQGRSVHRMADEPIHARCHQGMLFPDNELDREIASQIRVTAPEQPERSGAGRDRSRPGCRVRRQRRATRSPAGRDPRLDGDSHAIALFSRGRRPNNPDVGFTSQVVVCGRIQLVVAQTKGARRGTNPDPGVATIGL